MDVSEIDQGISSSASGGRTDRHSNEIWNTLQITYRRAFCKFANCKTDFTSFQGRIYKSEIKGSHRQIDLSILLQMESNGKLGTNFKGKNRVSSFL